MNNIQNIQPNLATTIAAQSGQPDKAAAGTPTPPPLFSGESVTVSSAATSDLEKLVARIKAENEDTKTALARLRLSSLIDAFTSRYGALDAEQARILEEISKNNAAIDQAKAELEQALADLADADAQSQLMQSKIESLERAIALAIEEGRIHRENVAKLKEQIAADADNEDLKAQLAKEEAALENSEAALSKAQTDLVAAQAAAGALNAKVQSLQGTVASKESAILSLENSNSTLAGKLGTETLSKLLAAFEAESAETPDRGESPADVEKAKKKAIANDPAVLLREAMDKADEAILRTIDRNRDTTV